MFDACPPARVDECSTPAHLLMWMNVRQHLRTCSCLGRHASSRGRPSDPPLLSSAKRRGRTVARDATVPNAPTWRGVAWRGVARRAREPHRRVQRLERRPHAAPRRARAARRRRRRRALPSRGARRRASARLCVCAPVRCAVRLVRVLRVRALLRVLCAVPAPPCCTPPPPSRPAVTPRAFRGRSDSR